MSAVVAFVLMGCWRWLEPKGPAMSVFGWLGALIRGLPDAPAETRGDYAMALVVVSGWLVLLGAFACGLGWLVAVVMSAFVQVSRFRKRAK